MKYQFTKLPNGWTQVKQIPETPEDEEEFRQMAEERKNWCQCEEDHETYYVPDNVSEVCLKHHYCCSHCHKIVQIG